MIKVLIFSGIVPDSKSLFVGGWISGFLDSLRLFKQKINISVSYISDQPDFEREIDGVKLYPLVKDNRICPKIKRYLSPKTNEEYVLFQMLNVVEKSQPDIIQIFGTETVFGLIASQIDIPVVIHLQGLMNAYINAWFPPAYSMTDIRTITEKRNYRINKYFAERELRIFSSCRYYLGRTEWDKCISTIYAPDSNYFHCDELLRPEFYQAKYMYRKSCNPILGLSSILSSPLYKGHDVILKTAYLLKEKLRVPFKWKVYGIDSIEKAERKLGLKACDYDIEFMGRIKAVHLIECLQQTDIFIHPSYIDNSPNSVCEAQYMGVPVIACNVGGLSSLIENEKNGILVPANEPHLIASYIKELKDNTFLYERISSNARQTAVNRHSRVEIVENLINIYHKIIERC